jgi:hypothetical protein
MTFFKRSSIDRDITFRVPDYHCFACNDTGIVHNSDGYLSNELPGYDQNYDLAIICWCKAAYPQRNDDGSIAKSGFRDDSSNICNNVGVDIPKDKTRLIHTLRKDSWESSCKELNRIRQENMKGNKTELPSYILKVKQQLTNTKSILNDIRETKTSN